MHRVLGLTLDAVRPSQEAAFGPMREIDNIQSIRMEDVRPINHKDFSLAMTQVRASVAPKEIDAYLEWDRQFGSHVNQQAM